MALPSSGSIRLQQIADEFGGTTPHNLSEYYGAASGVPTSGELSFSDFYGTQSGPTETTKASSTHDGNRKSYEGGVTFDIATLRERTSYGGTAQSFEMGFLERGGSFYPALKGSKSSLYNTSSSYDGRFRVDLRQSGTPSQVCNWSVSAHRGKWEEQNLGGETITWLNAYNSTFQLVANSTYNGYTFYWFDLT